VLWIVCNFQFITSVVIFNSGPPFRAPLYTNILFTFCLICVFTADMVWVFYPFGTKEDDKNPFDLLDYTDPTTGK
jgi:magnesium-transporting ATPase (P-type)